MRIGRAQPVLAILSSLLLATGGHAQSEGGPTTPESFFGHPIGADYVLPNYDAFVGFMQRLDAESDRMTLVDIGRTAEGRTQYMAVVTSPENHRELERWRDVSARLARAEGLTEAQARELAREGKAVVWFDGGLHANEVLGAQQLMETVYQLVRREDPETLRILDEVVVLAVHANPDGMQLVSDWYMREREPHRRSTFGLPRLYQKYIGHDNNRDFFMSTQPETENINRQLYHTWFPQIVYNHHQTGPTGTVLFAPPFRDPFNFNVHPLIITGIDAVGAAMHSRFIAEDKPGATMRRGANYSTWWNGGLRTLVYFHNMIGLLTESIGSPTPVYIPFLPSRQLPSGDLPAPIEPQRWHFRRSIDYSVTANYAVFDYAARNREHLLFNIWSMGRDAIEAGSRDSWTPYPRRIEAVRAAMEADGLRSGEASLLNTGGIVNRVPSAAASERYMALLRAPELRDPRGYVIPADQPDFPTAVKFVNALLETGVDVHRATAPFSVADKSYPAGSFVVKTAQAFRPHVLDMFEPQDHPDDFLYPGGPPIPPYDAAGWTLAFQMGIRFDRVLEGFDGPFEKITDWNVAPPPGRVDDGPAAGFLLAPEYNDAFGAVVGLVGAGERVERLREPARAAGAAVPAGTFFIHAGEGTRARLEEVARRTGLDFSAVAAVLDGARERVRVPRIALLDVYGGSMPSGWTRWILEQQGIPFEVVYPQRLDSGNLRRDFDVIVLPHRTFPSVGAQPPAEEIPREYRDRLGHTTPQTTAPELRRFLEQGGRVVAIGSSTRLAGTLNLPITSRLLDETGQPLSREQFYVPGSVLRARVDTGHPLAYGLDEEVDLFFDDSPVFALAPGAHEQGIRAVVWFDSPHPLRSGWAWGQEHLQGGAAAVEAPVGEGTLFLFGPEILFRSQPHGTYKLFFNALAGTR